MGTVHTHRIGRNVKRSSTLPPAVNGLELGVWKITIKAVSCMVYNTFRAKQQIRQHAFLILYSVSGMGAKRIFGVVEKITSSECPKLPNLQIANVHCFFSSFQNVQSAADLNSITILLTNLILFSFVKIERLFQFYWR